MRKGIKEVKEFKEIKEFKDVKDMFRSTLNAKRSSPNGRQAIHSPLTSHL